ncbi:MAG: hypothetical protein Q9209_003964 [Squamulea sp. 1 TL-2023]
MDAFSVSASVVGLTATCLKTAKDLHDIKDKFHGANLTISAICTETTIISASLSRIQSFILSSPDEISDKLKERPDLVATLDSALTGCYVVFDVLQVEVQKYTQSKNSESSNIGFRAKLRYVWNETAMQDVLTQMRGLQTALVLLLQLLGSETVVQLKKIMNNNTTVLEQVVQRTSQFRVRRPSRAPKSIFDVSFTTQSLHYGEEDSVISSTFFHFDDEVVNSQAYRRAFVKASAKSPENDATQHARDDRGSDVAVNGLFTAAEHSANTGANANMLENSSSSTIWNPTSRLSRDAQVLSVLDRDVPTPTSSDHLTTFMLGDLFLGKDKANWLSDCPITIAEIEAVENREVKRQEVLQEIITTERSYLRQLQIFWYLYKYRLSLPDFALGVCNWQTLSKEPFAVKDFPGFEAIYHVHRTLLYDPLRLRQGLEEPWLSDCWDIFRDWMKQAKPCYLEYMSDSPLITSIVHAELRKNPWLVQFLEQCQKHPLSNEWSWETYLKIPSIRLQQYSFYIKALLKLTDQNNPKHYSSELQKLLEELDGFGAECEAAFEQGCQKSKTDYFRSRIRVSGQRLLPEGSLVTFREFMRYDYSIFRGDMRAMVLVIRKPYSFVLLREVWKTGKLDDWEFELLFESTSRSWIFSTKNREIRMHLKQENRIKKSFQFIAKTSSIVDDFKRAMDIAIQEDPERFEQLKENVQKDEK